ncbi:MAG TPA: hypothetical protein VM840_09590, partial [Actinomycetota bacterium]|nr:hypothetical protein [Actinomycetota bacterium]
MRKGMRAVAAAMALVLAGPSVPAGATATDGVASLVCSLLGPLAQLGVNCPLDGDGDGYTTDQGDCDDTDPAYNPAADDRPDLAFLDTDCDGIDGSAADATFVATSGSDTAPGTMSEPKATVVAAVASGATAVYVSTGSYPGSVSATEGLGIFGGYDATDGWSRSAAHLPVIAGAPQAVLVEGADDVELQLLDLRGSATPASRSAYGVRAVDSSGLRIVGSRVSSGPGLDGITGNPDSPGAAGSS